MSQVVNVNSGNFQTEIIQSAEPVVVDLWAPWCAPCRASAPVLEVLAKEFAGKVKVAKVNVDEEPAIAQAFQVEGIPTFAVLYKGALYGSVSGFGGKAHLQQVFEEAVKLPGKVDTEAPEAK